MVDNQDLREILAALEHKQWSHWMRYIRECAKIDDKGRWILDSGQVIRWLRQMNTDYADLPEKEKESDRTEADNVLEALGSYFQNLFHKQLGG